jgi:3-hydroxybutyryl-CoA dehydrogenase
VVALLVDEAADLVDRGEAGAEAVDIAMRLGTNYPYGPLEWGDRLGAQRLVGVLEELAAKHPNGRYRVSEWLAHAARTGETLRD